MTLQPVTATSQSDSLICLPVKVIDTVIIELQELDYLRDRSLVDAALIENLEQQSLLKDSALANTAMIIQYERENVADWKEVAESERRKKLWWKWGSMVITSVLVILCSL